MRTPTWQADLKAYIKAHQHSEFSYGKHDCALFAAGAVKAVTGKDLADGLRGYKTLAGGLRRVREKGFDSHVDVFAASLIEIPPLMARVGDIAVMEGDALGVVQGRSIYVATPKGVGLVPLTGALRAFRV